ncbi:Sas10 C-terminal domain-containing protein [Cardiosporidium cionae]|uniref:Sas10 C-terminal domain-containing protein n=1 Tax=Cardiosporidium cionae TaxID=476202 RepID=A0ABQ7J6M3_9APIC|nr:Sas10 C-terminal domain-containing protein [Cardiosporidium cionae]|eukprot:KAF8819615.1 Sas10 C-terminal domain-containing protein [Cardiosporidium cionae]
MGRPKSTWKNKNPEMREPLIKNNEKKLAKSSKKPTNRSHPSRGRNRAPDNLFSDEVDDFYSAKTQLPKDIDYIPFDRMDEIDSDREASKAMNLDLDAAEESSENSLGEISQDENGQNFPEEEDIPSEEEEENSNARIPSDDPSSNRTKWGKKTAAYYEEAIDSEEDSDEETMNLRKEEAEIMDHEEEFEAIEEGDYELELLTSLRNSQGNSKKFHAPSTPATPTSTVDISSTIASDKSSLQAITTYEEELQAIVSSFEVSSTLPINFSSTNASENLSSEALISILQKNSAEFEPLLKDMQTKFKELNEEIRPLLEKMDYLKGVLTEEGHSFLHTKNQLFIGYLTYLSYYILLKCNGHSVKNHPVIQRLVEFRLIMEKMKPIEQKLRYQIDRLLDLAETSQQNPTIVLKPRPGALVNVDDDNEGEEEESKILSSSETPAVAVYKAPKLLPVEYTSQHISEAEKAEKESERQKIRLRRSEMVHFMREELTDEPEEMGGFDSHTILSKGKNEKYMAALRQKQMDREKFEEENLLRLPTTKKDKKERMALAKQPKRSIGGSMLGDLVGFAETVVDREEEEERYPSSSISKAMYASSKKPTPLNAYLNAATQAKNAMLRLRETERSGDTLVQSRPMQRERPTKKFALNSSVEEDFDKFGGRNGKSEAIDSASENEEFKELKQHVSERKTKKRDQLLKRSQKYIPPVEASLEEGSKRATSVTIQKNRGLTRQRKPIEGNARAHYRLKYTKKMQKLKSQRPEMRSMEMKYSGETSGLSTSTRKSQPLS